MAQPSAGRPATHPRRTSGLAIAAFVCSLIVCFPPLSLLGAVLGIVFLVRHGGRDDVGGKGLAIASLPIAAVSLVLVLPGILAAIAIPNFLAFQARSKTVEGRSNLMALYKAERRYAARHDGAFVADMHAIGFEPAHGNRYAYFLAPAGPVDVRDGRQAAPPAAPVIIGIDTRRFSRARPLLTFADTGCPVTLKRTDLGPPLRVAADGTRISRGRPYHERDDVDH